MLTESISFEVSKNMDKIGIFLNEPDKIIQDIKSIRNLNDSTSQYLWIKETAVNLFHLNPSISSEDKHKNTLSNYLTCSFLHRSFPVKKIPITFTKKNTQEQVLKPFP